MTNMLLNVMVAAAVQLQPPASAASSYSHDHPPTQARWDASFVCEKRVAEVRLFARNHLPPTRRVFRIEQVRIGGVEASAQDMERLNSAAAALVFVGEVYAACRGPLTMLQITAYRPMGGKVFMEAEWAGASLQRLRLLDVQEP